MFSLCSLIFQRSHLISVNFQNQASFRRFKKFSIITQEDYNSYFVAPFNRTEIVITNTLSKFALFLSLSKSLGHPPNQVICAPTPKTIIHFIFACADDSLHVRLEIFLTLCFYFSKITPYFCQFWSQTSFSNFQKLSVIKQEEYSLYFQRHLIEKKSPSLDLHCSYYLGQAPTEPSNLRANSQNNKRFNLYVC